MKYLKQKFLFSIVFLYIGIVHQAQEVVNENNQHKFDDFTVPRGNTYRSASGIPGPEYWQNSANYVIEADLDDIENTIKGKVTIIYQNNSPESLDYIWLYLEQNRFMTDSRGTLTTPLNGNRYAGDTDGGMKIEGVEISGNKNPKYIITDTRMQLFLDKPLKAKGGKTTLSMFFEFKIPIHGMDRMGQLATKAGTIYSIAQWYPKVAVFDDVIGWNTEPYLGAGEFYLDYGTFNYKITVPYDHIVVGSGKLVNASKVLTKEQIHRLENARKSDSSIYIIQPEEVGNTSFTRPKQNGKLTWHFKMTNSRDVAFASSKSFIWDAAKINLPNGKNALAQSVYPKESDGIGAWKRATEYTKATIEHYSKMWFEYPYPVAVNVASNAEGMEYPGVSFCNASSRSVALWVVTDHEFGHNWFPMIVGSNERRFPWMDEGFNTFINHYSTLAFNNGEYPSNATYGRTKVGWLTRKTRESIDTYPDIAKDYNLAYTAYYKPATGLFMLREYILDHERFDNAFKTYIKTWAYKHPQPLDFFNSMNNTTGENLNWFWKSWFYGNKNIDLAISNIIERNNGYLISFSNIGEIPMPVVFEITYDDGSKERKRLPVEIWHRSNEWDYFLNTTQKIRKVEIDPDKILPDTNGSDNVWTIK